jgi:HEAT repeat protein
MHQERNSPDPSGEDTQQRELALLIAELSSADPQRRRRAARALAKKGAEAEQAIPALIAAFGDSEMEVRSWAVTALARMGARAVPALLEVLGSDDPDQRRVAVVTLGEIGPAAALAVPVLTELLEDDWLGSPARSALGTIQSGRAYLSGAGLGLRSLAPWLLLAWLLCAAGSLAVVGFGYLAEHLMGPGAATAATCAHILGGVGAVLGLILGHSRGSWRSLLLGPLLLGLGGATAGLLLGGLLGGAVAPVVRALRGS